MNIEEQMTYETLKYGYIKPVTIMNHFESVMPAIRRRFHFTGDQTARKYVYQKRGFEFVWEEENNKLQIKMSFSPHDITKVFKIYTLVDFYTVVTETWPKFVDDQLDNPRTVTKRLNKKEHAKSYIALHDNDWEDRIPDQFTSTTVDEHLLNCRDYIKDFL